MRPCVAKVFFTLACLVAAGALAYAGQYHGSKGVKVAGIPLFLWLILAAVIFPCIHFARWAMDAFVTLLEAVAVRSGLTNVHYVLIGLSDALRCVPLHAATPFMPTHLPTLVQPPVLSLRDRPLLCWDSKGCRTRCSSM